jgi:NADPH:quinone reductase-like Zn-dependent oxidoreductase
MKAVELIQSATGPVLVEGQTPRPQPGIGELLIRVRAAGVIPTELLWYPTLHRKTGEARTGAVPGHEFSGVVAGVGKSVGCLEIGQEVFGMNDWYSNGALAEYCVAPFRMVAPKPPRLTHAEAASAPISALTAWQGPFDRAKLQAGERVLVHGGAGAVGTYVIQLAALEGAHVIATTSAHNRAFVTQLGAAEAIDYRNSRFEESVGAVDVVFDTVGGETLGRSWQLLKPGGRLVTIASTTVDASDSRTKAAMFIVEPNQKQLSEIGDLLEAGRLQAVVDCVVPLSQAGEVYAGRTTRRGRGKMVIEVAGIEQTEKETYDTQRKSIAVR